jgi:hypothetical protein
MITRLEMDGESFLRAPVGKALAVTEDQSSCNFVDARIAFDIRRIK